MKAADLFQHCIPYLYVTSQLFLYIDISVYRHKILFPTDVDISGLHCFYFSSTTTTPYSHYCFKFIYNNTSILRRFLWYKISKQNLCYIEVSHIANVNRCRKTWELGNLVPRKNFWIGQFGRKIVGNYFKINIFLNLKKIYIFVYFIMLQLFQRSLLFLFVSCKSIILI